MDYQLKQELTPEEAKEICAKLMHSVIKTMGFNVDLFPEENRPLYEYGFNDVWLLVNWLSSAPVSQKFKTPAGKTLGAELQEDLHFLINVQGATIMGSGEVLAHITQLLYALWQNKQEA